MYWLYLGVSDSIELDVFLADDHCASCHHLGTYHQFLILLIKVCIGGKSPRDITCTHNLTLCAVLLIMRVYALYDRKRWILYLFLAIAAADIPTAVVSVIYVLKRGRRLTDAFYLVVCTWIEYHYKPTCRSSDSWLPFTPQSISVSDPASHVNE